MSDVEPADNPSASEWFWDLGGRLVGRINGRAVRVWVNYTAMAREHWTVRAAWDKPHEDDLPPTIPPDVHQRALDGR